MYQTPFHTKPLEDYAFLVTGGAGFIGSNIVEYLLKHGARKVRVLDNLATGRRENVDIFLNHPNYEFFEGDIRNPEDCKAACEGIDMISHQAALGSIPRSVADPITTNNVNAGGFVNILHAAKEAGIERVVFASSSSVYGDNATLPKQEDRIGRQISPYAVSKYTNELYAYVFGQIYGMKLIGMRYFNVFGPRQDPSGQYAAVIPLFADHIMRGKAPFINGDGTYSRDFTFVENVVQINLKALLTDNDAAFGEIYNVAVGVRFTIQELYDSLCEILEVDMKPNYRETRVGDIPHSLADISKARNLLGYDPQIDFKSGLELTVDYFKDLYREKSI